MPDRENEELTAVDTSDVLSIRERAVACHLSQVSPFDNLPSALRHHLLTTDHVVEVAVDARVDRRQPNELM